MEFFDKKQDVLDIQLTTYGKQLLSRGMFVPKYYTFSDDGIMYDSMWMTSGSSTAAPLAQEEQSMREPRIQEDTPRLKSQYRKLGAERAVHWLDKSEDMGIEMYHSMGSWLETTMVDILEIR